MENLPTQLCLRNKHLNCFRACLRTPTRTVKYQVLGLRGFIRSSLQYLMLVIQKKRCSIGGRLCLEAFHCQLLRVRQVTRCRRGGQSWVNRFGSDRRLHRGKGRSDLTKFESLCLRKQQSQPRLLDSIIFHTIPRLCAVMECIQWVAWRTSSLWKFVSLSWCFHAFGRSKSSDAMPRAQESTEFDSTFQGKLSFETSSSWYTKKVSVPGRSCGCIELSLMERTSMYPYKPCWNPLSLSMEGGEMRWIVCWCLYSIRLFKHSLLSRPTSQEGGEVAGFSWCQCLVWQHRGMDSVSHFTLARCCRTNSFAAYVLAFTRKSNIKCLNVP